MKVIFYGKLASMLGRELELAVEEPCTVARLLEQIVAAFPAAAPSLQDGRVRAVVESRIVLDDHRVGEADQVEFLAPVSGG
jgi:molybdopterin converting factor small subunit